MKIRIKLFDKSLPIPEYKSEGAACFDLYSRLDLKIAPRSFEYVPLNVAIEIPKGYWGLLVPRSSLHKMGLLSLNSIGIIDSDYVGDEDEYKFVGYNFTDQEVQVSKGDRIAQLMILPVERVDLEVVDSLGNDSRGGFGTTGSR